MGPFIKTTTRTREDGMRGFHTCLGIRMGGPIVFLNNGHAALWGMAWPSPCQCGQRTRIIKFSVDVLHRALICGTLSPFNGRFARLNCTMLDLHVRMPKADFHRTGVLDVITSRRFTCMYCLVPTSLMVTFNFNS